VAELSFCRGGVEPGCTQSIGTKVSMVGDCCKNSVEQFRGTLRGTDPWNIGNVIT